MEYGAQLLPKVREQDQAMSAFSAAARHLGHSRTQSLPCNNGYPAQFGAQLQIQDLTASARRRSISPAAAFDFNTPMNPAMNIITGFDPVHIQHNTAVHALAVPVSSVRSHSRHSSSGSVDVAAFSKYHFPTYRQSPGPQQPGDHHAADAMSHLVPMTMPHGQVQSYPARRRNASPPVMPSRLSVEVDAAPMVSVEQTTLRDYLTLENPVTRTLHCEEVQVSPQADYAWFDVRNVYEWSDFTVNKILSYEGLDKLLACPVDTSLLPEPERKTVTPVNRSHLADICANYYLVKLNAALTLTQGASRHLSARALTKPPRSREQPEFVSNYSSDADKTIDGDGRGRIVGIVRGFDEWNSGMRREDANKKIQYLRGLAALHKHMRDHRCRYGFIMNEIELVCVRAGGPSLSSADVPLFGFLELAAPVPVSRHGTSSDSRVHMTVGIALWYLHMLARDDSLPGQLDWQLQIGGPAAGTRQHHHKKDDWIPTPNTREKRRAKHARGWVFPDEPISSKERGRAKPSRRGADLVDLSNRLAMSTHYGNVHLDNAGPSSIELMNM